MQPRPAPARTLIEALIAIALFGCIPVVVKFVSANAYTIGIFRLSVAFSVLLLLQRIRGPLPHLSRGDAWRLGVIGSIFFAHWITYFLAIKMSSASVGAIGLSTYGIHLVVLGALFTRHRLVATDVVGVLLAVAGAIAIVPSFDLRNDVTTGLLLAIGSALFYATLPLLHQRWSHIATPSRTLGQFGFALLFFLLFLPASDWHLKAGDWGGLLFLALGSTLVGHTLWVRVTTRLPPSATSIVYYGNLPFALLLSVLILGEPLSTKTMLGAVLIVAGSLIGLISRWRQGTL